MTNIKTILIYKKYSLDAFIDKIDEHTTISIHTSCSKI